MTQTNRKQRQCSNCGRWMDDDEIFCVNCGTPSPIEPQIPELPKPESPKPESQKSESLKPEQKPKHKVLIYLAAGCGIVLIVCLLLIFFFGGKIAKKASIQETQGTFSGEEDGFYTRDTEEETYLPETKEEEPVTEVETDVEADIDAVHNRNCTVSGLLFYTDNMETPVLVLEVPVSLYVNSTAGEQVYYETVSQISFGTCSIGKKKLQKYNNVNVEVKGSLWAENDFVYIDVQELSGELPETESETTKETEPEKNDDYILPESDSRYLTEADVSGLSLKEINYAKNEIYARRRRKFDSVELQKYFKSKEWYKPKIEPGDFSASVFNSYERKNVEFLDKKEKAMQEGGYKLDQ